LFELSPDLFCIMSVDGLIVRINPALQVALGRGLDELAGRPFAALAHPDDMEATAAGLAGLALGASSQRFRNRCGRADGSYGSIQWTVVPDIAAGVLLAVGHAEGAAAGEAVPGAAPAQEWEYRALVEHSADLVAIVGTDRRLVYVSPSFEAVLGHRRQDWNGRDIFELICPDDLAQTATLFARSLESPGEIIPWQLRVRHADGTLRWLEGTGTNHVSDSGIGGIMIDCRDVTERKRAEEVVRQNEQRLRVAIATADLAVFEMDAELRYTWMYSPQLGYSPQQVVGRTDAELLGDDGRQVMAIKRRVLESGRSAREEVRVRAGGSGHVFALTVEPVRADDGRIVGLRGASADITERNRADNALTKSEELLRQAVRVSDIGIFEHDQVSDTIYWSPRQREIHGWGPDEPVTLADFIARVHPDDAERIAASVRRAHDPSGTGSWEVEHRIVRRDGSTRWLIARSQTFFDSHGTGRRPVRTVGAVIDITEHKRAEESLRRSEAMLRRFYDLPFIGMAITSPETKRWLQVNQTLCDIFGYPREELVQKTWAETTHPDDLDANLAEFERVMRGETDGYKMDTRFIRPDGAVISATIDVKCVPAADGRVDFFVVTVADITERKRAEEALLREKAFSEAMLDSVPGVFYLFDHTGRLLRWNRSFETVSGYSAEEMAARPVLDFFTGKDRTLIEEKIREVFETGAAAAEASLVSKDGRQTPYYFVGARIAVDGVPCCLGMGVDITAQKHLEAQLRQSQKLEGIGQLAGGIAHDFNNLLTVVMGHGTLLQEHLGPDHPAYGDVEVIERTAARAAEMTRQLLAFSRRQMLQPEVLDLNTVIEGIMPILRRLVRENIEVVVRPAPGLGAVRADRMQLELILVNLAANASDAMPRGGRLTIETANVELDETYARQHSDVPPGAYAVLTVSDTGIGMDAATQARIFEPFFTTKEPGKGTGLGLATVYGIVKQSGGNITVVSEPGHGTTFTISLPWAAAAAPVAARPTSTEVPRGTETILLAEDADDLRDLIREVLETHGYTVLAARHGGEALQVAGRHPAPIHLLVTDAVMPQMGGSELAGRLRIERPGLKILYVSGYIDDPIVRHDVLESGTPFLQKPFTTKALARKVREVLDGPW
jgi:PAS domain S-box-containing protein